MNYRYSRNYYPPAPIVDVAFINVTENLKTESLPAFIDTGADGTIVPIEFLLQIEAPDTEKTVIRSPWGEEHEVSLFLVNMQLADLTIQEIEVVGDEISNEIILGRDVLNRLRVLLNGPEESITVST
jgi:predicted aspartyl protease